ncbi:protein translocase subunit SecF [Candidatus Poribacteria bacterium]|nr:protein translocase subunit SecF [Candidatus Poribacteria bacterium]
MQFLSNANFNFMSKRRIAFVISGLLIIAGVISLIIRGGPNFGVDFRGGVVIQAKFDKAVTPDEIRSILQAEGLSNAAVQQGETDNEIVVSTKEAQMSGDRDVSDYIKEILSRPSNPWKIDAKGVNTDKVSASVGRDFMSSALKSTILALVLILGYIWFRFELRFGVAAIITLIHDVIITLGIFSILREEINLATIAGFLTIIGYSLNDTIVVFDRIRENTKIQRGTDFDAVINTSINQTLSRTIITSITTLFAVVSIFALSKVGTLHTLSLALLIGVIVGTYSSIFVASPILHGWHLRLQKEKS